MIWLFFWRRLDVSPMKNGHLRVSEHGLNRGDLNSSKVWMRGAHHDIPSWIDVAFLGPIWRRAEGAGSLNTRLALKVLKAKGIPKKKPTEFV